MPQQRRKQIPQEQKKKENPLPQEITEGEEDEFDDEEIDRLLGQNPEELVEKFTQPQGE